MAKFANTSADENAPDPVAPTVSPVIQPSVVIIDNNNNSSSNNNNSQNIQTMQLASAQAQAQASVGLAQTSLDKEVIDEQINKEEEHWIKAYWRPAMGWLYMLICFMDFVGFPMVTIFLPVIYKGLQETGIKWLR